RAPAEPGLAVPLRTPFGSAARPGRAGACDHMKPALRRSTMNSVTVLRTSSRNRTSPAAISRSAVTAGLLSQSTPAVAPRDSCRQLYQPQTVGDFVQAVFDGNAGHVSRGPYPSPGPCQGRACQTFDDPLTSEVRLEPYRQVRLISHGRT